MGSGCQRSHRQASPSERRVPRPVHHDAQMCSRGPWETANRALRTGGHGCSPAPRPRTAALARLGARRRSAPGQHWEPLRPCYPSLLPQDTGEARNAASADACALKCRRAASASGWSCPSRGPFLELPQPERLSCRTDRRLHERRAAATPEPNGVVPRGRTAPEVSLSYPKPACYLA